MDVFAYGTLQSPGLLSHLIGRVPTMEEAILPDHVRLVNGPYVTFPHLGENVKGLLLRDLTAQEIDRFDRYEGVGYGYYVRKAAVIRINDGTMVPCEVYLGGPNNSKVYQNWIAAHQS